MNCLHRMVAASAVVAIGLCNFARGQVLDQVPSNAVGVFEVKDLQATSTKVAKFAKTLGIDQFDPRFADPLAALMDEMELKQGVNKSGDMAIAFFEKGGKKGAAAQAAADGDDAMGEPRLVVLVPVSDYKGFLGNFTDVKDAGQNVSEVTVPKNKEKLFVEERGKYAIAAMDKSLLADHGGLKIQGPGAREAATKDAIFYVDIKALRPTIEKGMAKAKVELDKQKNDPNAAKNNPFAGNPQMGKMIDQYMKAARQLVQDSRSITMSLNLTDLGIATATVADFEPDSDLGKLVAQVRNTGDPLMGGLPETTYFAYAGAKLTPEVTTKLISEFLEPMLKGDDAKPEVNKAFAAMTEAAGAMKSMSIGYVSTGGGPGEGLIGVVAVGHGDAKKVLAAQKDILPAMSSMMGMSGSKITVDVKPGEPKTVDGVDLQTYTMKFNADPNDAQAAQAQQMISVMYGRDGLTTTVGAVNADTFVQAQGGNDKLLADLIAAAKNNSSTVEQGAQVKKVAAQLPKERAAEMYVAVDNIASAAVKALKQQGLAVPFKLPPNLPPIGVSAATEGTSARIESLIPTQLIQSLTAAGMQAFMQMNGGPGGAQGGGI